MKKIKTQLSILFKVHFSKNNKKHFGIISSKQVLLVNGYYGRICLRCILNDNIILLKKIFALACISPFSNELSTRIHYPKGYICNIIIFYGRRYHIKDSRIRVYGFPYVLIKSSTAVFILLQLVWTTYLRMIRSLQRQIQYSL